MVIRILLNLSVFLSVLVSFAGGIAQKLQLVLTASLYDGERQDVCFLNDTAYVTAASGVEIIDFTIPAEPQRVGQVLRPDGSQYVALVHNRIALAIDDSVVFYEMSSAAQATRQTGFRMNGGINVLQFYHNHLYFADHSGWGRISCVDAGSPTLDFYLSSSIPVNAMAFDSDSLLVTRDDGLTLIFHLRGTPQAVGAFHWQSNLSSLSIDWPLVFGAAGDLGFYIADLNRQPADREIGWFYTYGYTAETYPTAGGLCVADRLRGLMMVGMDDPEKPFLQGINAQPLNLQAIDLQGSTVVGVAADGVYAFDISNPYVPQTMGRYGGVYHVGDLALSGDILAAAVGGAGFCLIDVSDLGQPAILSETSFVDEIRGLDARDDLAALACGDDGLVLCDIHDPTAPVELFRVPTVGFALDVAIDDSLAIVADRQKGFRVYNITDPTTTRLIGGKLTTSSVTGVARRGNIVFTVGPDLGLRAFDISFAIKPKETFRFETAGKTRGIFLEGNHLFLAVDDAGVYVFNISEPSAPELADFWDMFSGARRVAGAKALYYVLDDVAGVTMVDYREPGNPRCISTTRLSAPGVTMAYGRDVLYLSGDPYLFFLRENPPALRGDMDNDGVVSLLDAVLLVNYLFRGGAPPLRLATVDLNTDGRLTMVDLIWLIRLVFS